MVEKLRVALKTRSCSFGVMSHSEDRENSRKPIREFEGDVEIDGPYFRGKKSNKHACKRRSWGHGPYDKVPLGIRERKTGHFKDIVLPNTNKKTIQNIIHYYVKPGSTIITNEHRSYKGLDKLGYNHKSINHSRRKYVREKIHTNGTESIWALAKRKYKALHYWFCYKQA